MFRTLALLYADPAMTRPPQPETVFATHPLQLSRWLEQVFAQGGISNVPVLGGAAVPLGDAAVVARLSPPPRLLEDLTSGLRPTPPGAIPGYTTGPGALGTTTPLPWDHLIYAYLVESTGVIDVLGEVVRRFMVGETLEAPSVQTLEWTRATEELFFRDPPLFHILGATSTLRPHARDNRWNAYYRMFGCTPPQTHPDDVAAWKRDVGAGANLRFIELWHELLRQVWMGVQNARNAVGANPTDPSYLAYLCQTIGELLRLRRRGGMLAREEFAYVCMLSWFHLTLESDTPVVTDLRATASGLGNPADRLAAIATRVGMRAAPQSRELFELADLMSVFLWALELDVFTDQTNAEMLYAQPVGGNPIADSMIRIIDLWQSATGERLKDAAVTIAGSTIGRSLPVTPQPIRLPAGTVPPRPTGALAAHNGQAPAPRP
ncbi:MAG: hypothetical protein ACM3ML_14800 [Micromonosporaceae bacterium]